MIDTSLKAVLLTRNVVIGEDEDAAVRCYQYFVQVEFSFRVIEGICIHQPILVTDKSLLSTMGQRQLKRLIGRCWELKNNTRGICLIGRRTIVAHTKCIT